MRKEELLDHLVDLARRMDFDVRYDRGSFRDGSCRLQDKRVIILNRTSPVGQKIAATAKALNDQPLEGIFLLPAVREVITQTRNNSAELITENHHG
ncbi:hypothetical protein CEE37_01050 [candidate division LCP-89 bacterium B3_LCP]|uniref:Uncharacterized protein n=1 Tax=candidate division LCP-89 bacterium B3_LCP TaxID=2012998 RepID=A0A532V517_UNCL8|nr:MAG: hypothetical protein CEE37_01050 [candidate division LCP-89 bacterium B3_LCP]